MRYVMTVSELIKKLQLLEINGKGMFKVVVNNFVGDDAEADEIIPNGEHEIKIIA